MCHFVIMAYAVEENFLWVVNRSFNCMAVWICVCRVYGIPVGAP